MSGFSSFTVLLWLKVNNNNIIYTILLHQSANLLSIAFMVWLRVVTAVIRYLFNNLFLNWRGNDDLNLHFDFYCSSGLSLKTFYISAMNILFSALSNAGPCQEENKKVSLLLWQAPHILLGR